MPYAFILISWFLFGFIHSLTASTWLKQRITGRSGWFRRHYRLLYNAIALLTFLPVLWLHEKAPVDYVSSWHGTLLLGLLITLIGAGIGLVALLGYDLAEFVGLPSRNQSHSAQGLRQTGLLQYVRHPLYTGILLSLLGIWSMQPDWSNTMLVLAAALYIRIGIYFEEQKLVATFGDTYKAYRQRVPMLFPDPFSR